jgi:hypothetical protein
MLKTSPWPPVSSRTPSFATAGLNVVATTSSMGVLVTSVGGDAVKLTVLAPPDRDAHVPARPAEHDDRPAQRRPARGRRGRARDRVAPGRAPGSEQPEDPARTDPGTSRPPRRSTCIETGIDGRPLARRRPPDRESRTSTWTRADGAVARALATRLGSHRRRPTPSAYPARRPPSAKAVAEVPRWRGWKEGRRASSSSTRTATISPPSWASRCSVSSSRSRESRRRRPTSRSSWTSLAGRRASILYTSFQPGRARTSSPATSAGRTCSSSSSPPSGRRPRST